ncbi:MAG: alpha/beta hydrolase, partial [Pseudomonadota bacterium]
PKVGTTLNNLAGLYGAQGRYAEAEPLYKRSLSIREKALGPDHPDVGQSLNNLAGLYGAQGRYAEVEPLYKRSLSIREKALGPDHPKVGTTLNNLAALYKETKQSAEEKRVRERLARMPEPGTRHIPVYFATTRARSDQDQTYGGDDSDVLSFGRITMQVPEETIQKLAERRAQSLILSKSRDKISAADVFKRVRHRALTSDQLAASLKASISRSALFKKQALIFVHGFNVDFDEATQRISQVAFDLEFDGALIAFSWASLGRGNPIAYARDRGRADKSVARFVAMLDQLSSKFPNVTLHIMAHSMGNRILTRALHQISERPQDAKRPKIGEVILAHADVDPEWCEKLGKVHRFVRGITNYVNQDDWALWIAKGLRIGKSRCGRLPRVYEGIETIDTTGMGGRGSVKTLVTGKNHHGVFANDPLLFGEITRLIAAGQRPPQNRTPELAPRKDDKGGTYWAYDKARDIAKPMKMVTK